MKQNRQEENKSLTPRDPGAAFLLAQVGAHAASRFALGLAEMRLAPPHAGILRILAATPAISQQALASALGTVPSRLVGLVDELESRGLLERGAHPTDRRTHALRLTEKGRVTMDLVVQVARSHRQALLAALSEKEQQELTALLQRVADQQGLTRGVHPGFANIGKRKRRGKRSSGD